MNAGTPKRAALQRRGAARAAAQAQAKRGLKMIDPARAPSKARPAAKPTRESLPARQARAARILKTLRELYPDATTALRHGSALELLMATILSAQCTDQRVNLVTPALFRAYPNPAALADAKPAELEALIRSTGFYRNKAKNLIGLGKLLRDEFNGQVPDTMDALLRLPGVARKTANCVLGAWFRKNEGLVVDTHVGRLALRLRLLKTARNDKDAVRIEQDLIALFPREAWTYLSHALIEHGRRVCTARNPNCAGCALAGDCPSAGTFIKPGRPNL